MEGADSNKTETDKGKLEEEEAKKIVESLTDSITSGEKKRSRRLNKRHRQKSCSSRWIS